MAPHLFIFSRATSVLRGTLRRDDVPMGSLDLLVRLARAMPAPFEAALV
jgi:hypothetical protein